MTREIYIQNRYIRPTDSKPSTQALSRLPPFLSVTDPLFTSKHSMFTSSLTLDALLQLGNVPALEIPAKPLHRLSFWASGGIVRGVGFCVPQ